MHARKNAPVGHELAIAAARHADDKKAEHITVLDLRGLSTLADYFVICSAGSSPHLNAIRREIADQLKIEYGISAYGSDGGLDSQWVVLDFVDVVVHILHAEKREFYALEKLWSDAPRIEWEPAGESRA